MKKILCAFLCVAMLLSTVLLVACSEEEKNLKFGLGVYTDVTSATNAASAANGKGEASVTAAAVTLDADGKIVACVLDTATNAVQYTAEGKAIAVESFKTKGELGAAYGMKEYAGAAKEWFEQRDAFQTLVVGKTLAEVKALIAGEDNKGTEEVVNAGCTIMIHEFVYAIEKACNNAADSNATKDHALKLGVYTEQTNKDATDKANGESKLETTVFAAAVDGDGKVVATDTDCVQIAFGFDAKGTSAYDLTKKVESKREKGAAYGMKEYAGASKEWFEQADAFEALCIGKTATEIAAFAASDNYGTADVKAAGCTILVNGFTKAAVKIG